MHRICTYYPKKRFYSTLSRHKTKKNYKIYMVYQVKLLPIWTKGYFYLAMYVSYPEGSLDGSYPTTSTYLVSRCIIRSVKAFKFSAMLLNI